MDDATELVSETKRAHTEAGPFRSLAVAMNELRRGKQRLVTIIRDLSEQPELAEYRQAKNLGEPEFKWARSRFLWCEVARGHR